MYRPTHDAEVINRIMVERYAHANEDKLAALARSRRPRTPSTLARIAGRLSAAVTLSLHHRPMPRTTARSVRP
jgi:hypothetical protein